MGEKDITEKTPEDYADVFADVVNVLLFDGEQRVLPEDLADTTGCWVRRKRIFTRSSLWFCTLGNSAGRRCV